MSQPISDQIRELCEALVLLEPHDMQGLADVHTRFQNIAAAAAEEGARTVVSVANKASEFVEDIILEEVPDKDEAMKALNDGAGALQALVCDNRAATEIHWPEPMTPDAISAAVDPDIPGLELPEAVDEAILTDFLGRQNDVLAEWEALTLKLEQEEDPEATATLKRLVHTLKGEAGMLGMVEVERVCHTLEDGLTEGLVQGMTEQILETKDWLAHTFDAYTRQGMGLRSPAPVEKPEEAAPPPMVAEAPPAKVREPRPLEGDTELLGDFVQEAMEHLEAADVQLLTLESTPDDADALNAVFRAFHTIKGVAGFLALDEVQDLSHEAESLLDLARKGAITLAGAAIDVTFEAVDMLKNMVEDVRTALESGGMLEPVPGLPSLLERIASARAGEAAHEEHDEFLGELLVRRGVATREAVERALEIQESSPGHRPLGDILVERGLAKRAAVDEALHAQSEYHPEDKLGEIMVRTGTARPEDIEEGLRHQRKAEKIKLGEVLVRSGSAKAQDVAAALRAQRVKGGGVQVREAVKVDASRLDLLVDVIGELVIAESMVTQSPELLQSASPHLLRHLRDLDKITRELQQLGTSLRMVSIKPTFQKMARLVRDLSKKSGKQVDFVTQGEDTELDKTVVDKIGDPLIHMVRNAVDHGLESNEQDRQKAGKSPRGRVELRAFHKGGNIHVEIEDDGRGLDREAILAKAESQGLIAPNANLSDREIWNLIFEAGFSTAKQITDVSGRGVGMDVVRRNIENLRGTVEIRSQKGKGSVFSIRLPLTLAIIDGMVVRVDKERFVVPTLTIIRSLKPEEKDISTVAGRGETLNIEDRLIPILRVNRTFGLSNGHNPLSENIIMVVETDGRRTGLVVDEILGQQQIVIKSLGETMKDTPGIAGGAIMADGRVGLILDVAGLVKIATEAPATRINLR